MRVGLLWSEAFSLALEGNLQKRNDTNPGLMAKVQKI